LHATASRLLGASLDARAALLADAPTTALLRPLRFATLGAEGRGGGDRGGAAAAALRLDAAGATFNLTHDLIRTSTNLPCFAEIWGPTLARLSAIKPKQLAKPLRPLHAACLAELRAAIPAALHARLPLLLQRAPVAPIKLYNPVFDDDFQPERSLDPDRQRAERQKLQNATFWEAMSWWWWEEHVSIPEEERMAAELERLFVEEERNAIPSNNLVFTTGGIGLGTSTPSQRLTIASNGASGLSTVSPTTRLHIGTSSNARSVGSWEAEGIRIDSETHPNFLRKIIVHALLGIKWTPIIPTPAAPTRKSSQSHYARLSML
jgi:hypothetical protein